MPDQISLFPDSFTLFDNSLKKDSGYGSEKERNSIDDFFSRTKAYHSTRDYFDLLNFITKFTKYSPLNCYLIQAQNPFASYVTTANRWLRKFGRRVISGARPIIILAPMSPVLFLYDVADTEGPPLPKALSESFEAKGRISSTVWKNTIENCARDLIRIFEGGDNFPGAGSVMVLEKAQLVQVSEDEIYAALYAIQMNKGFSISQKYAAIVHELAHLYCGHIGSDKTAWWTSRRHLIEAELQREIEAESISYLVCKRQRIETPAGQFLADCLKKDIKLPEFSLDIILRVAGHIEAMGRRVMRKRKKKPG